MAKCSFCHRQITAGKGIIFVEVSGRILNFCSPKCRKNHNIGRQTARWVKKQSKEMTEQV